jgi:hypothetical protein
MSNGLRFIFSGLIFFCFSIRIDILCLLLLSLSGEWVESAKEEKNLATKIFCFSLAMGHGYYWLGLIFFPAG